MAKAHVDYPIEFSERFLNDVCAVEVLFNFVLSFEVKFRFKFKPCDFY